MKFDELTMDRDTIRVIILAAGVLIVILIYVWGRWGRSFMEYLNRPVGFRELGLDLPPDRGEEEDDPLFSSYGSRREPPASSGAMDEDEEFDEEESAGAETTTAGSEQAETGALGAPVLIQLSVVAGRGRVFAGADLREAFLDLDLIHGEMGIYHRYDIHFREPQFSIASLVEPGSFPADEMDDFECPGIVLFFQPGRVADPLAVFEDLVTTCHELAQRLGGIEWDERRQPLTEEKIAHVRTLLRDAVGQS